MSTLQSEEALSSHRRWADYLKVLAHPTRLAIVETLTCGTCCVSDVCELLDIRQPNLSQHLAVLRREGIVHFTEEGKRRCYYLVDPDRIALLLSALVTDRRE